jgi:hypothetical protein
MKYDAPGIAGIKLYHYLVGTTSNGNDILPRKLEGNWYLGVILC